MNFKKVFSVLVLSAFFLAFFAFGASAQSESGDVLDDIFESSGAEGLFEGINDDTAKLLSKLGLDEISIDSLMDISPKKVVFLIFDIAKGKLSDIANNLYVLLGIIILISLIDIFVDENNKIYSQFNTFYTLFFSVAAVAPLISCVSNVMSAICLSADFSLLLVPVFAGLITASGNPMLALTYNSAAFTAGQLISQTASELLSPFIGINLSLCVTGAINPLLKTANISGAIKKIFTVALGLASTLFTALLSIKGLLAGSADSLAAKGAKFIVSTFIPVIGGSISDGLASVLSSLTLLNSIVGITGIIVIILISLPAIMEVIVWWFVLYFCSFACSMLGKDKLTTLVEGLSGVISMLAALLIFTTFIFIISIGLTLSVNRK